MTDKEFLTEALTPLHAESLSHQAAEVIRQLIASGKLRGGQRLVEAQIAAQLAVSRGPVRDAFRQLREEGLLRDLPRRGTYVVSLGPDDVRDLLDLRAGLETQAARLVVLRQRPGDLDELADALAAIRDASSAHDGPSISAADFAFHETLCRLSGSDRLHRAFVRYATELRLLLTSEQEGLAADEYDAVSDHESLLQALRSDGLRAQEAFRVHIENARDALVAQMRASLPPVAM